MALSKFNGLRPCLPLRTLDFSLNFSLADMPPLTQEQLKAVLRYDPSTGEFTWIQCLKPELNGSKAGHVNSHGYIAVKIKGKHLTAHRLAWLYMTGQWPKYMVDHIDGNRANNAWGNLRDVPRSVNNQNIRSPNRRNTWSRLLGVSYHGASGKFEASLTVTKDGRKRKMYLGLHKTQEEAHEAYLAAKRKYHEGNTL